VRYTYLNERGFMPFCASDGIFPRIWQQILPPTCRRYGYGITSTNFIVVCITLCAFCVLSCFRLRASAACFRLAEHLYIISASCRLFHVRPLRAIAAADTARRTTRGALFLEGLRAWFFSTDACYLRATVVIPPHGIPTCSFSSGRYCVLPRII